jgi:hypothetical protein
MNKVFHHDWTDKLVNNFIMSVELHSNWQQSRWNDVKAGKSSSPFDSSWLPYSLNFEFSLCTYVFMQCSAQILSFRSHSFIYFFPLKCKKSWLSGGSLKCFWMKKYLHRTTFYHAAYILVHALSIFLCRQRFSSSTVPFIIFFLLSRLFCIVLWYDECMKKDKNARGLGIMKKFR